MEPIFIIMALAAGAIFSIATNKPKSFYSNITKAKKQGSMINFQCDKPLDPINPLPYEKIGTLVTYPIQSQSEQKVLDLYERRFGNDVIYRVIDPRTKMQISFDAKNACVSCSEKLNDFSNVQSVSELGDDDVRQLNDKDIVRIPFIGGKYQVQMSIVRKYLK